MNAADLKSQAPNLSNDAANTIATVQPYFRAAAIALGGGSPDAAVAVMALAAVMVAKVIPALEQISDGLNDLNAGKPETDEAIRCVADSCREISESIEHLRTTQDAHLDVIQREGILVEQKKEDHA